LSNHERQIAHLEAQIAELKARLPKHSVPPVMILKLEDLEDELAALKAQGNCESDESLGRERASGAAL